MHFYSASSLKQQSAGRHVAPLGHIILIPSQPVFALSPYCCVLSGEATNTNFIIFGLTRPGLEPTIYRTRGEHANHYATDTVFGSFVRKREFYCVNKKCSLEFLNKCLYISRSTNVSNVVEFQSSRLQLLTRTNTLALNTTLNRMKLRDCPVCEACPCNATELLQHFLLECPAYKNIRDQNFQEIVDHRHVFMPCLDFTEWSPLRKLQLLIEDTWYYFKQECGDFFDRIGKRMFVRCCIYLTTYDWINSFLKITMKAEPYMEI